MLEHALYFIGGFVTGIALIIVFSIIYNSNHG